VKLNPSPSVVLEYLARVVDGEQLRADPERTVRDLMHMGADLLSAQVGAEAAALVADEIAAQAGDVFAALGRGAVIGATEAAKRLRGRAHLRVVK
jgi:hypothetical protein